MSRIGIEINMDRLFWDKTSMEEVTEALFFKLLKEASEKCFGYPLTAPLSEADSKLLSIKIQEKTGLVIGVKSIRNYSLFMFGSKEGKKENPSIATLDTFARYVLNAPYTTELQRKNNESHHPYWFQYKSSFYQEEQPKEKTSSVPWRRIAVAVVIVSAIVTAFYFLQPLTENSTENFTDNFGNVSDDSLRTKGWEVHLPDQTWWSKRQETAGHLSMYTLRGDNWKSTSDSVGIKNLLVRPITNDCFTTEIHLSDFFPTKNWQQAGILLSEDTSFTGKVIRLSISYNDFFGGYKNSPEIIIQGLSSSEGVAGSKPEEFTHFLVFKIEPGTEKLVADNLSRFALKIEKKNNHFRFLYSNGSMENFAFKEVVSGDFSLEPRYIGLFAIQGFSPTRDCMPVNFDSFHLGSISCDQ